MQHSKIRSRLKAQLSYKPTQTSVLLLQFLHPACLFQLQAAVFLAPAIVSLFGMPASRQVCPVGLWLTTSTSTCHRIVAIRSGLCFFRAVLQLLSYQFL